MLHRLPPPRGTCILAEGYPAWHPKCSCPVGSTSKSISDPNLITCLCRFCWMPTFYQTLKSMRTGSCLMDLLQPWHLARFLRCSKGMVSQVLTGGGGVLRRQGSRQWRREHALPEGAGYF